MRSRHRLQVGRPDAAVVQHKSNGERAALVLVPSISRLEVRTHSCFPDPPRQVPRYGLRNTGDDEAVAHRQEAALSTRRLRRGLVLLSTR